MSVRPSLITRRKINAQNCRRPIYTILLNRGGWAAWHLPGGPVGPPARWAATSNVVGGSGIEDGERGSLAEEGGLSLDILFAGPPSS